jgi:hypothetical protein
MVEVEIDFRKTIQENANTYFERAKKAKSKIEASKKALTETRKKIKSIDKEALRKEEKSVKPRKRRRGKWFNKFHWGRSTEGFLIIAGRNATQNEMIFKKYIEADDVVLHAEITGAPLTVVKSEGKEITPSAIREAGEIAAAYSSAWKAGVASIDVYWIKPDQVSQTAQSGEYLPKGSFMIRGKKNYLRKMELKISIGIIIEDNEDGREAIAVCGNVQSIGKNTRYMVTLKPGSLNTIETGKEIIKRIMYKAVPIDRPILEQITTNDLQKLIPAGGCTVLG